MHLADIAESHPEAQLKSEVDAAVAQAKQLDDGPVLAAIGYVQALRHRYEGRPRDAIVECERALELAEAAGPAFGDLTETLLEEYALAARDAGDGFTTASLSDRRLNLIRQQRGLTPDRSNIKDLCHTASGALDAGNLVLAKQLLGQAQALAKQGFQDDIGIESMLLSLSGRIDVDSGAWQKGEDALRRSIDLQEQPDCPPLGGLANDYFNRSLAQVMLGNGATAVQSAQRALDLDLIQYPERHPQVILDYHNLAEITTIANADTDLDDLVTEYQHATGHSGIPLVQGTHPNGHPWWSGVALGRVGASADLDEALAATRQLLEDRGREVLDDYPHMNEVRLTVLNPLGVVTMRADDTDWFIVEILQSHFHQRTVFVDPEAVLLNLEAENHADTAGSDDTRPQP
jgi:tetratricopeptide (TPR) repeat protein